MKITKRQLKRIIKEEHTKLLKETSHMQRRGWRDATSHISPQQQQDVDDIAAIIASSPEGSREYWQTVLEQALIKTGKGI